MTSCPRWLPAALSVLLIALAVVLILVLPNRPRTVGRQIKAEQITEFYYTLSASTCPPHQQRYHFYIKEGTPYFFHESRAGHAWPLTEENIVKTGSIALSSEQWAQLYDCLQNGTVQKRKESTESGDSGPWLYLYWEGDRGTVQQFSFASYEAQLAFESLCSTLSLF